MAEPESWPVVPLSEVADEVTVGFVGPMTLEYRLSGVPFLRSQNVKPLRIETRGIEHISLEFHERIAKSRLGPGDVVIVRTGAPGTCAVVPESLSIANCADLVVVRPGPNLNPHYLAYFVNFIAQHHVYAYSVGAVQQHFNVSSAKALPIPVPPRRIQDGIVAAVGPIDDKIELNRGMNRTLEAMAQALFRSWFVDFDPVSAKTAQPQPLGMDATTVRAFASDFTDSELGPIPKGWSIRLVRDEYRLVMGQSPPGTTYNTNGQGSPSLSGENRFRVSVPFSPGLLHCSYPLRGT
jgi:type I restriction enzyme S subunit